MPNGYRVYGQAQVDALQHILLYRELGMSLSEIKAIVGAPDFDRAAALERHLRVLAGRREQIERLIGNVEQTVKAMKGETKMSDYEKFEGFKQQLIAENEDRHGKEVREKYGDEAADKANAKILDMSEGQYENMRRIQAMLEDALRQAVANGDPASEIAQKACALHRQWLCFYWENYTKEAHLSVSQMYVDDPRFAEYYEKIAPGCAVLLRDAVKVFCDAGASQTPD
jgi:DNA-binding transcriptional MerR regulator